MLSQRVSMPLLEVVASLPRAEEGALAIDSRCLLGADARQRCWQVREFFSLVWIFSVRSC